MKFRNTKTGVVIDVQSNISGENWEPADVPHIAKPAPIKQPTQAPQPQPERAPKQTKKQPVSSDEITVKEIKQELDALGVKYSSTAKKQELYDLMMGK